MRCPCGQRIFCAPRPRAPARKKQMRPGGKAGILESNGAAAPAVRMSGRSLQKAALRKRTDMTVSEFLVLPGLPGLRLLAGAGGADRKIAAVTAVDTPDGAQRLKGGELVLTTGYMLGQQTITLPDFLRALQKAGAAGLGILEKRYLRSIPADVRALADELDLPLVSVPEQYDYPQLAAPVLAGQPGPAEAIHRQFMALAINDSSVPQILETLSAFVGVPCAFWNTYFKSLNFSAPDGPLAESLADVQPEEAGAELLTRCDSYAVANHSEQFGYLLFAKGSLPAGSNVQTALEYAGIVLIMRIQLRISGQQMAEKYKEAFLEDLLLNNVKADVEIHNRARLYGWDFTQGALAAVVDINNIKRYFIDRLDPSTNRMLEQATEVIFKCSIREMQRTFPEARYFKQSDLIAFIISEPKFGRAELPARLEATFARLQKALAGVSPFTITLGVGQYYENIREVSKSYSEARVAINLGYSLHWFDRILFYERLGLYRLLAPVMNSPEADDLCRRCIQPLADYDEQCHSELLPTLQEILRCGWNLKEAARELYIHYNSIKYRYAKICRVLNMDLGDHDNRSLVEVAMKLYLLNRHQPGRGQQTLGPALREAQKPEP